MADLKSGVILEEGEKLVMELEAELWAVSSNPVKRFFQTIMRGINMILGNKRTGFVVITNKRVIEVTTLITCYCFTTGRLVSYVLPSSVKEAGYKREATCLCCCSMYKFYYESFTQGREIILKGATEEEAQKVATAFYRAIASAQKAE